MNDFDLKLKHARAKQSRLYVFIAALLLVLGTAVAGVMMWTNGTSVSVHPDEAAKSAKIQLIDGLGLAIGDAVYAIGSEPVIRVTAAGFRAEERKITFMEKGRSVEITLRPLPGMLIATTVPENAETRWSIDKKAVAIAPNLEREVEAGTYIVGASHPHFETAAQEFSVARGEVAHVNIELKRISGRLRIDAIPHDASITIDTEQQSAAPLDLIKDGGVYRVELTHPDYITVSDMVEVITTQPLVERTYHMTRKPATLGFTLSPPGGNLLVDGTKVDPSHPLSVTSRVAHQITYLKDGYFSQSQTLTLDPAEVRTTAFTLKPEFGILEVQAQPRASVYINSKLAGQTPLVTELPGVPHKVSIRKSGYRSVEKTLTPNSKSSVLFQATLQTEQAARLASAPKHYVNAVGISLTMFMPGPFTMGAPRHELGQRANEFVRTIKLEKPFYAAAHEVTKEQYAKFKGGTVATGMGRLPVTGVSWLEAAVYCNWLSAQEGLKPVYVIGNGQLASITRTADGYRMLSEAEWEWLARRAGRVLQTVFPWGDESVIPKNSGNVADESAKGFSDFFVPNYNDGYTEAAPVGSFAKEPSGLFDLTGNVSEWVHDYYSLVPPGAGKVDVDPLGASYGDSHVVKGSSWRSGTRTELRAAYRDGLMSGRDDLGFRVGRYLYGGVSDVKTN